MPRNTTYQHVEERARANLREESIALKALMRNEDRLK
jgi:hypothetical protein